MRTRPSTRKKLVPRGKLSGKGRRPKANPDMAQLTKSLRSFARVRAWDQYHTPKNLVMALSVEVAELMEHFQWLGLEESQKLSRQTLGKVREEIGDVLIYLLRLADKLGIDPLVAATDKMELNRLKYPADRVRGQAKKYSDY